ncbi:cysteine hydrolase [Pseudoxanthomonas broegbernensis]|uniref:Cysteine hydrolase n=1 Tax=Pseudoxanthomonas broegbernensis TaxID=83619 RepID=A0A7V8GK56_9GAMM|nr:cysteine hydrolase family protein [Pseudoxanthomonas broegbernensis]KAF1684756.1 cysteine hydrolase [Pseudoxanthomonas broegbernensis]MBB6064176.1 nicotinamidase-related amidase [Pseudoxanthomonas broegbernensis]
MPRRALLVIDVQNEYFDGVMPIAHPPVAQSLPRIVDAMEAARAAGIPVVAVRHGTVEGAPAFAPGSHGWQLHPQVERQACDLRLDKRQASALAGTGLDDWLRARGIDTLVLAGYMTHNCLLATALDASQRGLSVEVLADAAGSPAYANAAGRAGAEELHRVALVVLHSNFAAVTDAEGWKRAVRNDRRLVPDDVVRSHLRSRAA